MAHIPGAGCWPLREQCRPLSKNVWLCAWTYLVAPYKNSSWAWLCFTSLGASPEQKWLPKWYVLKAFKGKWISLSHLRKGIIVAASKKHTEQLERKRLGKETLGGIRALESSLVYQEIQKATHMTRARKYQRRPWAVTSGWTFKLFTSRKWKLKNCKQFRQLLKECFNTETICKLREFSCSFVCLYGSKHLGKSLSGH